MRLTKPQISICKQVVTIASLMAASVTATSVAYASVVTITSGSVQNACAGKAGTLTVKNFSCSKGDLVVVVGSSVFGSADPGTDAIAAVSSSSTALSNWKELVPYLSYDNPPIDPGQYINSTVDAWYTVASQAVSGQTITAVYSQGADNISLTSTAYTGLAASSPLDKSGSIVSSSGFTISASVKPTTTIHTVTFMLMMAPQAPATFYSGTGYMQGQVEGCGTPACNGFLELGTSASSGTTITPTATWDVGSQPGTAEWVANAFTLKLAK